MSDLINIRLFNRKMRIGHGLKMVTGSCSASASAANYDTSKIEGYFNRCFGMTFNKVYVTNGESAYPANWIRSTAHLNGQIYLMAVASGATELSAAGTASGAMLGNLTTECPIFLFTAWGV